MLRLGIEKNINSYGEESMWKPMSKANTRKNLFQAIEDLIADGYQDYDDLPYVEKAKLGGLWILDSAPHEQAEFFYSAANFDSLVIVMTQYVSNPINVETFQCDSSFIMDVIIETTEHHLRDLIDHEVRFQQSEARAANMEDDNYNEYRERHAKTRLSKGNS